ncbi:hypothetical protein JM84_2705 [Dokdonia sp. Hel_I_63]|uniref:hypothetical protein n=1 Tax=Dokdonia sp. Hel_I_63 TaxID=1249996 RepID=UPI00119AFB89|nr:hypothetical protein [Dokdonia sp. Hel_I_63]TVZ23751.1 hypothetical protein JM84_2705 [Dokdonia sp. Hel_I_63]
MSNREALYYIPTENYLEMIFNRFRLNYEVDFKIFFLQAKSDALKSINNYDLTDKKMRGHIKFDLMNLQSYYLELYDDYILSELTFEQRCESIFEQMIFQLRNSNSLSDRYPLYNLFKINLKEAILLDYLNSEMDKIDSAIQELPLDQYPQIQDKKKKLEHISSIFKHILKKDFESFSVDILTTLVKEGFLTKEYIWHGSHYNLKPMEEFAIFYRYLSINKFLLIQDSKSIYLEFINSLMDQEKLIKSSTFYNNLDKYELLGLHIDREKSLKKEDISLELLKDYTNIFKYLG